MIWNKQICKKLTLIHIFNHNIHVLDVLLIPLVINSELDAKRSYQS